MLTDISFPRDGRITIIYGFPTIGKSYAGDLLASWDQKRCDYATKRPIRVYATDTDAWFGHAKASNQRDPNVLREIAKQMLCYACTATIPTDTISVLFTNFNHVEFPDTTRVFGFVPASADAVERHLRMREDNWKDLLPRFLSWYDRVMISPTVQQMIRVDHLYVLKPGDFIANHLTLTKQGVNNG